MTNKRKKQAKPNLQDMYDAGRDMMNRSETKFGAVMEEERRFREMFGVGAQVALVAWNMLITLGLLPEGGTMIHFLWTLCFMKVYCKQGPLSVLCGNADHKTITKWVWLFISALACLEPHLIIWENRFKGDKGNDCLVSVDGTDFRIPNVYGKTFASHKYKKRSAVRYEVCLCILTGDIVWIHGPFAAGKYPDITIFRSSLMSHLGEYERVEADDGYIGEAPRHVKCPKCIANPPETEHMQQRVRNRQETVNKRFKDWGILRQTYRHSEHLGDHGDVFRAIACLTQLAINNGEPLFSTGYRDPPYTNTAYDEPPSDDEGEDIDEDL